MQSSNNTVDGSEKKLAKHAQFKKDCLARLKTQADLVMGVCLDEATLKRVTLQIAMVLVDIRVKRMKQAKTYLALFIDEATSTNKKSTALVNVAYIDEN